MSDTVTTITPTCSHAAAIATSPCCGPLRSLLRSHGIDAAAFMAAIEPPAPRHPMAEHRAVALAEFETGQQLSDRELDLVATYVEVTAGIEDTVDSVNADDMYHGIDFGSEDADREAARKLMSQALASMHDWYDALDTLHAEFTDADGFSLRAARLVVDFEATQYVWALHALRREIVRYFMAGDAGCDGTEGDFLPFSNGWAAIGSQMFAGLQERANQARDAYARGYVDGTEHTQQALS